MEFIIDLWVDGCCHYFHMRVGISDGVNTCSKTHHNINYDGQISCTDLTHKLRSGLLKVGEKIATL